MPSNSTYLGILLTNIFAATKPLVWPVSTIVPVKAVSVSMENARRSHWLIWNCVTRTHLVSVDTVDTLNTMPIRIKFAVPAGMPCWSIRDERIGITMLTRGFADACPWAVSVLMTRVASRVSAVLVCALLRRWEKACLAIRIMTAPMGSVDEVR